MRLIGVEAGGRGIRPGEHAARFAGGSAGVLQGTRSYVLQDEDGNIELTHSISAGLDYAAVGPGARVAARRAAAPSTPGSTTSEALGGVPAAGARGGHPPGARIVARDRVRVPARADDAAATQILLVNLSGRGDKDVMSVQKALRTQG